MSPQTLLVLLALLPPSLAILNENSAARTLCETDYCECTGSASVVKCSCSSQSPPQGELVLRADGPASLPASLSFLEVRHCPRVVVTPRAFALLRSLRRIELSQLGVLDVREAGLVWEPHKHENHSVQTVGGGPIVGQFEEVYGGENTLPTVTVALSHIASIPELPRFAFGGHLEVIILSHVNVGRVSSYAFTNLRGKVERIEFKHSNISFIDALAFRRIYLDTFVISDSVIGKFESRSFYECRVKKEFKFYNVSVDEMSSSAVVMTGPLKTSLVMCHFAHISGESFKISTRGTVTISDNTFSIMDYGALYGFKPMEGEELVKDSFLYNPEEHESPHTVPSIEDGYKPAKPKKPELKIKREFNLQNNTLSRYSDGALKIHNRYKVTFQKIVLSDTPCECSKTDLLATKLLGIPQSPDSEFASASPHDTSQLHRATWCRLQRQFVTLASFKEEHCATIQRGGILYVALGVAGLVLLVVVLASLGGVFWWRSRRGEHQKKLRMVVPETRTYRETELQVIVERAEPIPTPETHQLLQRNEPEKHVSFQK